MKKLLSVLLCLSLAAGASAQGLGSRMADVDLDMDLGVSPFSIAPISYIYFGFNGLANAETSFAQSTGFFYSQQLGVNILELAVNPFPGGRFSLGADFSANWYQLKKGLFWYPYDPVGLAKRHPKENGLCVAYESVDAFGVQEVKRSTLSVCTFGFPLTFSYTFGRVTMALGAALEVNLNGRTQLKGMGTDGSNISDTRSGKFYSKKIYTNRLTFDIHAGISYGGLGLFAKYSPLPKFNKEISNGIEVECGPQFQTWTVGLILGLGM